jgi:hypothetical protein
MRIRHPKLALLAFLVGGTLCPVLRAQTPGAGVLQVQATVLDQVPARAAEAVRIVLGQSAPRQAGRPLETAPTRLATVECSSCRMPSLVVGDVVRPRVVTVQYLRN